MHIILHQPEIPGNTGNIGRTCAATGTPLHLIEPLGFRLDEKSIKRAGMDYWHQLEVHRYVNFTEFQAAHPGVIIWMATTKARYTYTEVDYGPDDYIMFGKESAGIPEEILVEHEAHCIRIPMLPAIRSLNLSNAVAIVLYEALRQNGFAHMQQEGELHRLQWHSQEEALRRHSQKEPQRCLQEEMSQMHFQDEESRQYSRNMAVSAAKYFIAPGAVVSGSVWIGESAGVWYHAVVRGDRAPIRIGSGSNIQDNCVVHVDAGYPVEIGENVTVGHGAILHGCSVGDNSLIGMGSILMNGCRIGKNCIIGAGTLVTQGMVIPDNSLVIGSPGRVKRQVTEAEIEQNMRNAALYAREAVLQTETRA